MLVSQRGSCGGGRFLGGFAVTLLLLPVLQISSFHLFRRLLTNRSGGRPWWRSMTPIMHNDVWEVVPRPEGKSVVTSKWIYKVKFAADGSIEKHKALFVARGFSQVEGIDYDETFAPVVRYTSIWTIMAITAEMGWKIHQMDVKTAFLNGILEEEVYIEQPQGFEVFGRDTHVCRMRKALYKLKQAP